jgi:hypothetical protein
MTDKILWHAIRHSKKCSYQNYTLKAVNKLECFYLLRENDVIHVPLSKVKHSEVKL